MAKKKASGNKGYATEELLRRYFLLTGYYVVRGVPVIHDGFDVTDIDLWLYHRHSPVSRERANVDVKNKKTPQAIERIYWARGIKEILGFDQCIVATTDKRPSVVEYGRKHSVLVLDGNFLNKLKSQRDTSCRLTDESLRDIVDRDGLGKITGDWNARVKLAKSRLVSHLDFDGVNRWLEDILFFVEQSITNSKRREAADRLTYLVVSYFLIGLDYSLSTLAFDNETVKNEAISDGLCFGSEGKGRTEAIVGVATQIASQLSPGSTSSVERIRSEVLSASVEIPFRVLAEFFSKGENLNSAFRLASQFESYAYSDKYVPAKFLPSELKSVVALLLDFHRVDRSQYFVDVSEQ